MNKQENVEGWEKEFDEKFGVLLDWGHGDEMKSEDFKSFIRQLLAKEREEIAILLEDTIRADGFVGLSDKEWHGVRKFLPLFGHLLASRAQNQQRDKTE